MLSFQGEYSYNHSYMERFFAPFAHTFSIPPGVRMITTVTSIRWIGWGFAETLIPVFLFMFSGSYAETGLLRSAYDITYILALPIVGMFADRIRGTTLIAIGISLYLGIGLGYYLAGATGMVLFVVLARLLNGVGYALDSVGRETYFRRHTSPNRMATIFGYFDSVANFWWIMAALIGILLVRSFEIHELLFLIAPTAALALGIVLRFRHKDKSEVFSETQKKSNYQELFSEIASWNWRVKLLTTLNFFVAFCGAVVAFFLPIEVFTEGAGFVPVIVLGVITTLPALFGVALGKWFDRVGTRTFGYGLIAFATLLTGLGLATGYIVQILIASLIGVVLELLYVGSNELVTVYTNPEHFGRASGLMRSITNIGGMTGPLAAGIVIDAWGNSAAYFCLALIMLALAAGFTLVNRFLKKSHAPS